MAVNWYRRCFVPGIYPRNFTSICRRWCASTDFLYTVAHAQPLHAAHGHPLRSEVRESVDRIVAATPTLHDEAALGRMLIERAERDGAPPHKPAAVRIEV